MFKIFSHYSRFVFIVCIFIFISNVSWSVNLSNNTPENETVSLKIKNESLLQTLQIIEKQTGYTFAFDVALITGIEKKITIVENNQPLSTILDKLSAQTNLKYSVDGKTITLFIVKKAGNEPGKKSGNIKGKIFDEKGSPLPGANILILETNSGTVSNSDGEFSLSLLPGVYTAEVSFISFQKQRITKIMVKEGKVTLLDIAMKPSDTELGEVTITAEYKKASVEAFYAKQKESLSVSDGISADLIKKTPDNNVAQVLKRVAGVSVYDDKYVTIRGMSERYNNVQLNGSTLPSTEPNRRNFSFDVVPTGLVENITVMKTFTPDLPGEFTGGLVQVTTLSIPEKKFLNFSLGTGYNSISTGKEVHSNTRFTADWFLGAKKQRVWYAGQESTGQLNASINNLLQKNTWGLNVYTAMPMQNYSFSAGVPFKLIGQQFGAVISLTYRHDENIEQIKAMHTLDGDTLVSGNRYKFTTLAGAVFNLGWSNANHKISLNSLFNNRFEHTDLEQFVYDDSQGFNDYEIYNKINIGNLKQVQADGEHKFAGNHLKLSWKADYNHSLKTKPDDRFAVGTYSYNSNGDFLVNWYYGIMDNSQNINMGHVMYSELEETQKNTGANLEYSFKIKENTQKIKTGYLRQSRIANYSQLYLRPSDELVDGANQANYNPNGIGSSLHDYYSASSFADSALVYIKSSTLYGGGYQYNGDQTIHASYAMADFSFLKKIHLIGGVRIEKASISAISSNEVNRETINWLPAATLIYNFNNKISVRTAYSKTLARPDFRELAFCTYYNVDDRLDYIVVNALKQTESTNYDLRAEWYPAPGEVITIGAFYKEFKDPVESFALLSSYNQRYYMYSMNINKASLRGAEINFRKSLGFITKALRNLYLSGNGVIQDGFITYNPADTSQNRKRPLMGMLPYAINGSITWQGKYLGAAVNYNRNGRRLVIGGRHEKYDQYENPRDVIDLQITTLFLKGKLELKANVSDLLHQDMIIYRNCNTNPADGMEDSYNGGKSYYPYKNLTGKGLDYNPGDWVLNRVQRGTNYSISISYKL